MNFDGKIRSGIVYRFARVPSSAVKFPYITVSDQVDNLQSVDVVTVRSFRQVREKLKRKSRKAAAIEIMISPLRKSDGPAVGKWFKDVGEAYRFCKVAGWQLILSSGAASISEMISGRCFDSILAEIGICPERYWYDLNNWLNATIAKKVMIR